MMPPASGFDFADKSSTKRDFPKSRARTVSFNSIFVISITSVKNMMEFLFIFAWAVFVVAWQAQRRLRRDRRNQARLAQNQREKIKAPPSLHPVIDPDRCIGCGSCIVACPETEVLGLVQMKATLIQPDHCVGHGRCEQACPTGAITLVLGTEGNGVEVPVTDEFFQTRVPGVYVVGELGGIGLIRNAMRQGLQCIEAIAAQSRRSDTDYDVIIVGAGPAGLAATLQAAAKGLRYLTLEQNDIGGTILKYPRNKIVMTAPLSLPGYGKVHFYDVSKEELLAEWEKIIAKTGIRIQTRRRVEKIIPDPKGLRVHASGESYTAANVVLALGRRGIARQLEVPGEHLPKVRYELDDPREFAHRDCLVVGGGDSALECALMLADAGARVTWSYRQRQVSRAKARNREMIHHAVQRGTIQAFLPSRVKEILPQAVVLEVEGADKVIRNDQVFIMAGGILPFELLKEIGIEMRTLYGEPLPNRRAA